MVAIPGDGGAVYSKPINNVEADAPHVAEACPDRPVPLTPPAQREEDWAARGVEGVAHRAVLLDGALFQGSVEAAVLLDKVWMFGISGFRGLGSQVEVGEED
jgi:hypothetical protein